MTNDGGEGARGSGELTLVSRIKLHVADGSTFRDLVDWQDVADSDLGC